MQAHFIFSTSLLQVCSEMQLSMDQEPVCSNYNENGPGRFLVAHAGINNYKIYIGRMHTH